MQTLTKHNILMAPQIDDSKSHLIQEGIPMADDEELQKIRAKHACMPMIEALKKHI